MAHQSRAPDTTAPTRARTLVVHDPDPARRSALETHTAGVGVIIADPASIIATAPRHACGTPSPVGAVHLGDEAPDPAALAVVRDLAACGMAVIAYGAGLADWPIGRRCQALLAGAVCLLDTIEPRFIETLWRQAGVCFDLDARAARARDEAQSLFGRLGIVGDSEVMQRLYAWTARVAPLSDLHVLVTGETGTGKQLFAQALHRLDPKRHQGPFVVVNCGAISPALAESELFGHRRGAFTGAERDRPGLIRAAHGGVLLLDEIGEMEPGLQAKLLRVLQDGRVLGVGEDREAAVDVRVVAATHRNLGEMVRTGTFRADLFHRLNGLSLHVPPVRERRGDIAPLVAHVIARHGPAGVSPARASDEFLAALARVPLPGNVRELEHLVRYAIAQANGATLLGLAQLPESIWCEVAAGEPEHLPPPSSPAGWPVHVPDAWTLARSLAWCERAIVQRALEATDGNQARAARLLGVTPRSVYNKLRKYQLTRKRA